MNFLAKIISWGTGVKDYAKSSEYSTIPIIRSHQTRMTSGTTTGESYTLDYPLYIYLANWFWSSKNIGSPASDGTGYYDTDFHLYKWIAELVSTTGNYLIVLVPYKFNNYDDAVAGINGTELGTNMGYGHVEVEFPAGIFYDASTTMVLSIAFAVLTENPYPSLPRGWPPDTFDLVLRNQSLLEETAGPSIRS